MEALISKGNYTIINGTYNPFLLKNMDLSVYRIVKAINNQEKIVLYGSCDVDGITGISVLLLLLRFLNADVEYYIPDDFINKNNINSSIIKNHIKSLDTKLIITMGCGIESISEVELCKKLGMDIIITDYHLVSNMLPNTLVINPSQIDCCYPFKQLSTCGLAYKLALAISKYYNVKYINKYLDLVVLGILSGNVPLVDENGIFAQEGLKQLSITNNYGINALKKVYNVKNINLYTASILSYSIIPVVNAVGRMDDARIAVELFTTDNKDKAEQIAKYFNKESLHKLIQTGKNKSFI